MLELRGDRFTDGCSKFEDHHPELAEPTAKIYVKILLGALRDIVFAQLDTGAAWSVLPPDIARDAGIPIDSGDPAKLSSRFGIKDGFLVRVPYTLPAEGGKSFESEGIFFVSEDWPEGLTFLGYSGLLDSIRFALDPQRHDFYFGSSS